MLEPNPDGSAGPQLDESRITFIVRSCHDRLGRPLSPHDVEELIQDTLVAVWKGDGSFRGDGSPDAWIYGIARHLLLGRLRRYRSRIGREDPLFATDAALAAEESESPGRIGPGTAQVIRGTFANAGTTVDAIFRQHDVEGETFAQIAGDLGMKETAVKARYYRSMPNLRRQLRKLLNRS